MGIKRKTFIHPLSYSEIVIDVYPIGEDILAVLTGGTRPHLGCTVLTQPRPSLSGEGQSCTSSVINVTGHKDEAICRMVAERLCRQYGRTVVCTGGFHVDGIQPEQIRELTDWISTVSLDLE